MAANYDNTTWFYERLSKLVFGQAQMSAQEYFLKLIEPQSNILIIGGGTGEILESLTRLHPAGLQITYIEISANMLALSRKRNTAQNEVHFIEADIQHYSLDRPFDVVITAFLFDNFSEQDLSFAFSKIHQHLKPRGLWLNTDFQLTGPLWQRLMLTTMYVFFKIWSAVEVRQLPNVKACFKRYEYEAIDKKTFYGKFILSSVYKRF
ncbi:class I SAM-dependent methyltransferase [Mucilaginibacter sp. PAMB04274]|uniref:class I SAM-dependent methyltransferase n=1 Tax=Mucilaginibacter sp. PAMB04274 TaxID=3138568 RepID=UPI0031F6C552